MTRSPAISVQVVTGGHPFDADRFFEVFDAIPGIEWTAVQTPRTGADVVVFYDMPGLRFTRGEPPVETVDPTPEHIAVFDEFAELGTGLVFLHHAVASWPAWNGFADIVGARFHYRPAVLRGVEYPDSGYVFDVTHTVSVLDTSHPVCAGLGDTFRLTDELYCFPVFESDVVPLMRTDFPTDDAERFFSADHAIRGRMNSREGWTHPPGSNLVAWAKRHGNAPVVYLQFGDGPVTYANSDFRRILSNAIAWTASDASRERSAHS